MCSPPALERTEDIIYMPEQVETAPNLRFDPADEVCWGDSIIGTVKYLDGTD
jgi:hypothetical protein